jgi:signal transduction histidine kinase
MVAIAGKNLDRLTRITNNLLDLSRLESGRAQVNAKTIDLRRLVEDAAKGAGLLAQGRTLRVEVELPAELPRVVADPDMIAQVLHNLLDNALRYAKTRVVVSARSAEEGMVRVSVSDDGPGIPKDKIGQLFNKFVQVDRPSGGGGYKGTGLGLAICAETLKANHGRVWAESEPGKGSVFQFCLPREVAYASAQEKAAHR